VPERDPGGLLRVGEPVNEERPPCASLERRDRPDDDEAAGEPPPGRERARVRACAARRVRDGERAEEERAADLRRAGRPREEARAREGERGARSSRGGLEGERGERDPARPERRG